MQAARRILEFPHAAEERTFTNPLFVSLGRVVRRGL
jgi:hypothetical protein